MVFEINIMKDKYKIFISLFIFIIFLLIELLLDITHQIRMDNTNDFIKCVSIDDINNVKLCKNAFIPSNEIILRMISTLFILISFFYIMIKIGSIIK